MGGNPVFLSPSFKLTLSLVSSVVEKKTDVKTRVKDEAAGVPLTTLCTDCCLLQRHGGLIRIQETSIRIRKGRLRCPGCAQELFACAPVAQPLLPDWHHSLEQYLDLVGLHGIPEADRPKRCPKGCACVSHRHSHFERTAVTDSRRERIYIFRFRCPSCGYVYSIIPAFLEPYQQISLDLQEDLVNAVLQGATVEAVVEATDGLPGGGFVEQTIGRLIRSWNERLIQLESGIWKWMLARAPHLTLSRSASLWEQLRNGWQAIRTQIAAVREIRFLHGLNRLCFSLAVTAHG